MRKILTTATLVCILVGGYMAFAAHDSHAASMSDGVLYWPSYHDYQQRLADTLRDPEATQFKSLYFRKVNGRQYMCGLFNARNGMGGYTGYRAFYVGGGMVAIAGAEHSGSDYSIERICLK